MSYKKQIKGNWNKKADKGFLTKNIIKGKMKKNPIPTKPFTLYGFRIISDTNNSYNTVEYLEQAVGKTPAAMGVNSFNYGDWENAFFMPKPCMLRYDGTVDYYLDPNDYTKKVDGTASDVSDIDYQGNAMMEWPKIWYKFAPGEISGEGYFYVSDRKVDDSYHCWCNLDCNGHEIDHFYTAIYIGTDATNANKIRSLSGIALTQANTIKNSSTSIGTILENTKANNTTNNIEWYSEVFADRVLISMLLVLMSKMLDTQAAFGKGACQGQSVDDYKNWNTGALNTKGLFWGTNTNLDGVKVFGMEHYWGLMLHAISGYMLKNKHTLAKFTWDTSDGSTGTGYNASGTGYIDLGYVSNGAYNTMYNISKMTYTNRGYYISEVSSSVSTDSYNDSYITGNSTSSIYTALCGGRIGWGDKAGVFAVDFRSTQAENPQHWAVCLSCKPLAAG